MSFYQIEGGKQVQRHESLGGIGVIYPRCNPKIVKCRPSIFIFPS